MDALGAFFSMGGYAAFVWGAFAVAAVVLGVLLIASRRALRANEAALAELQGAARRQRGRRPSRGPESGAEVLARDA